MLKIDHKHRNPREITQSHKKQTKTNVENYILNTDSGKKRRVMRQYYDRTPILKKNGTSPKRKLGQKQNRGINQEISRNSSNYQKEFNMDDVDQLSLIKFLSKECSSIKSNQIDNDCASQAMSGHHLEDFSPLFDKIERGSYDKDDFVLEIYDISQTEPSIQKYFGKDSKLSKTHIPLLFSQQTLQDIRIGEKPFRGGKIKRNKPQATVHIDCFNETDQQIEDIFRSLDGQTLNMLTKSNCNNENLSTEVNYLIGSILTKIKFQGKNYKFQDFAQEFKKLIADSQQSELNEIFANNRLKRSKISNNSHNNQSNHSNNPSNPISNQSNLNILIRQQLIDIDPTSVKQISFQISPTFQQSQPTCNKGGEASQKLSKIRQKLTLYLLKNNLISTDCPPSLQDSRNMHSRIINQSQQQQNLAASIPSIKNSDHQSDYRTLDLTGESESKDYKQFSQNNSENLRVQFSLRSESQVIRGAQGSEFQLKFSQLNRHI